MGGMEGSLESSTAWRMVLTDGPAWDSTDHGVSQILGVHDSVGLVHQDAGDKSSARRAVAGGWMEEGEAGGKRGENVAEALLEIQQWRLFPIPYSYAGDSMTCGPMTTHRQGKARTTELKLHICIHYDDTNTHKALYLEHLQCLWHQQRTACCLRLER